MSDIILHLSSGQGPEECRWVVGQLAKAFEAEGRRAGVRCTIMEAGEENPASLLLEVSGNDAESFVHARTGTVLWVGTSPFRPHHRRRNWFVGVARVPQPEETGTLREQDITYKTMRASGPGGQHVNKTDSAVRATHGPTGISAVSQEQRSQHANRKMARLKLALQLAERQAAAVQASSEAEWSRNRQLERGNAVRTYHGARFRLKSTK